MAAPLHPSLPPKPLLEPLPQALPTYAPTTSQPEASSSTTPQPPLCAMCTSQHAKYTCPGCSVRTCSAPCSASHKTKTGCTGQRNKVRYVPMNGFTWGKMMDDYVFLEDVGRNVGEWGKEIVKGGFMAGNGGALQMQNLGGARGRGRGTRGRGRDGSTRGGLGKTKRDILKTQLQVRDIDMEMLPVGMERRKANQSTWDFKNQTALLTIEFKFHKPKDPLAPSSQPVEPPFTLLTHKNNIKTSLLSLLRSHIHDRPYLKKENPPPEWVKRLIYPDPEDSNSFSNPQCVMAAQLDPITLRNMRLKKASYSLDPSQPLGTVLRHVEFVEYPTIEIWEVFTGSIVDVRGVMQQREEGVPKRRKLNPKVGKHTIAGLLGDYGSDDEEERPEPRNALTNLGDYVGSDEEDESTPTNQMKDESIEMQDADADMDGLSDEGNEGEIDPAVLLELLRAAGGGELALEDQDDEELDWDDGADVE